jgi:hypothetical protein
MKSESNRRLIQKNKYHKQCSRSVCLIGFVSLFKRDSKVSIRLINKTDRQNLTLNRCGSDRLGNSLTFMKVTIESVELAVTFRTRKSTT